MANQVKAPKLSVKKLEKKAPLVIRSLKTIK
jgi:hypothetical protein